MKNYNKESLIDLDGLKERVELNRKRYSQKSTAYLKHLQTIYTKKIARNDFYYINVFQLNIINQLLK